MAGVLIDACYSGVAGFSAAQAWVRDLGGTLRFEVLTAAADRPAANGCFSKALVKLLRSGVSTEPAEYLHCFHLRPLIEADCPNQLPQHPSYNADQTLWLGKNRGRLVEPWAQTPLAEEIQRLTLTYQVTPALGEVVARSLAHCCVAVIADAGVGKSALAAALAWPKVAEGVVPAQFAQAVALLTEATTPHELARVLTAQLIRSIPGFREAQQAFAHETPYAEQQKLGVLEKQLVGPLRQLAQHGEVRLVIDALDRLATGARSSVMDALNELTKLPFFRVVVTARPDTELPHAASTYGLAPASSDNISQYLERRAVAQSRREEVKETAKGNWLVARVLADLLCEQPDVYIGMGQLALGDAYEEMLTRCGATSNENTQRVLAVLAAAGAGPLLPLPLLCAASEVLGGPRTVAGIRDELFRLRGLAARSAAGTDAEHVGLFHPTLAEHVGRCAQRRSLAAHRALALVSHTLAPPASGPVRMADAVQRYAFEREAEHFWAVEATHRVLESLSGRVSPMPHDNLRRWNLWAPRVEAKFGPDHQDTLTARSSVASWTGQCGDAREALGLFEELLPNQERVLGHDHRDTLTTRNNIAGWTRGCGNAGKALRLFKELLPDQERVLGRDHPDTLRTRSNIGGSTGESGDEREALRLLQELLPDQERVLGRDHSDTLTTRNNIAFWTQRCGKGAEALRLFEELLPDQERVLGRDHPGTLMTRNNIASMTSEYGDAHEALRMFKELLPDQERVLGRDHPETLMTRNNIAGCTAKFDPHEALRMFKELLPDQERVLGRDHPHTFKARNNVAGWIGECGDPDEALRLSEELFLDRERVLGRDHPDTLRIRYSIARWTGERGDPDEALRLFKKLLPDQKRVLGRDHPETLKTREAIVDRGET